MSLSPEVAAGSKESKILAHMALLLQDRLCLAPGQLSAVYWIFDRWGDRLCCSVWLATEGSDVHSCKISMSKGAQPPFSRGWGENPKQTVLHFSPSPLSETSEGAERFHISQIAKQL